MNRLTNQIVIGAIGSYCAFGLVVVPAFAQQGDHGMGNMAKSPAAATLPKCPVLDKPVNLAVSVATDDGPVFFCCKSCESKYQANPAKYAMKVAAQRKALATRPKIQVTCPVTKEPVNQNIFVEENGKKVYFCCKGCVKKYHQDPSKYAAALANSYTYQTKCPVTGEDIDPTTFTTTASGVNIYYCCKGCGKKFFNDPQKYAPALVKQGFTFNAEKMMLKTD